MEVKMSVPWQTMNKIRSKLREILGEEIIDAETFFTYNRDSDEIVSNRKINGYHFIFNSEGTLIKYHRD